MTDVCHPRRRHHRKYGVHEKHPTGEHREPVRKRHKFQDKSPQSEKEFICGTENERVISGTAPHDISEVESSMITSTRCLGRQPTVKLDLSPITPNPTVPLYQGKLHHAALFGSSPEVELEDPVCSVYHRSSQDVSTDKSLSGEKNSHGKGSENNAKETVEIHTTKQTVPMTEGCDLWDADDSFYNQLDLSRIISASQNSTCDMDTCSLPTPHQVGVTHEHTSAGSPTLITTYRNCRKKNTSGSTSGELESPAFGRVCTKLSELSNSSILSIPSDTTLDKHRSPSTLSNADEIFPVCDHEMRLIHEIYEKAEMNELKPLEKDFPDSATQHSCIKHSDKSIPHISQPNVRREGEETTAHLTPGPTLPNQPLPHPAIQVSKSRLQRQLKSNVKVNTTSKFTPTHQLQRAAVKAALVNMAGMSPTSQEKDIGPFYGLPSKVKDLMTQKGIKHLYDWQDECLRQPALKKGENLIYSLPTGGGKTLVAEILIMQQLLCHRKDAILILPFVSIVQEKVTSLSQLAVELGFLVEEYASSKGAIPPRKRRTKHALYVCTIEKAHALVNSLIQEARITEIGLAIVDELHMIGDGSRRGACLEICLCKLLYLQSCQIVGMSATLSNITDLSSFLKAQVYTNNFRPVDLMEYIKLEDSLYQVNPGSSLPVDEKFTHARTISFPYSKAMRQHDPDHLVGLVLEVVPDYSCLIFCATKKNCQNVAENICKYIPRHLAKRLFQHKSQEKQELLATLCRECDNHICSTLKKTIPYGAAYHHGGLTVDERKLIEEGYQNGTLCLLTATSTLAAGVNLPAKRVILRSPYMATELLTTSRYKQMVGRAGRAGKDTSGESILIVKAKERQQITNMLNGPLESCLSSLMYDEGKGMRTLVLALISLKITTSADTVNTFIKNTLCGIQTEHFQHDITELSQNALQQVIEMNLVKFSSDAKLLEVTKLGHAAFKGSIDIDLCTSLYADLQSACASGLVLTSSLHLLYLITPYDHIDSTRPNWNIYMRQYISLDESAHKVAELVGVSEFYMQCKMTGRTSKQFTSTTERRAQRFYLTLMLWEIIQSKSIWTVAGTFEVPRGYVQSLFNSAASFAFCVQKFCEDLAEFWALSQLLNKVVYDLTYCATADLLPLLEIPGVKQGRAKQLVRAGYKSLRHIAHADPSCLASSIDNLPTKVAHQIVAAAKLELAEKIDALKEEAEDLNTKPEGQL